MISIILNIIYAIYYNIFYIILYYRLYIICTIDLIIEDNFKIDARRVVNLQLVP